MCCYFFIFSVPNFQGICKRGQRKIYQSRKYQHCKSYIIPTINTNTYTNDNINQNNHIPVDMCSSSRYRCNNISSDNCAQNVDKTVSATTITNSNINRNINSNRNRNINRKRNRNRNSKINSIRNINSNSNIGMDSNNDNTKKSTKIVKATTAMNKMMAIKISHYLKVWTKIPYF